MVTSRKLVRLSWVLVVLAVLVLSAWAPLVSQATGPAGGPIAAGPPCIHARYKCNAVALGGKIYLVGGRGSKVKKPPVEVFDPSTGTWTAFGPDSYPEGAYGGCAACINGRIYAFAGKDDAGHRLKVAKVFDEASGTWTVLPGEASMGHNDGTVAVVGTKAYLFGGEDDALKNEGLDYSKAVDVFDASTGTWSTAAPMPFPRQDFFAVAVGKTIFTMGGQGGIDDVALDVVDALHTETNTWENVTQLPFPWEHPRAILVGEKLYILTGKGEGGAFVFEFDPVTREFKDMPTGLLEPRNECAAVELGGKIYVIAGRNVNGDVLTSMEIYDPALDR